MVFSQGMGITEGMKEIHEQRYWNAVSYLFSEFFKAPFLKAPAAAPVRVTADRALKKEKQEWELLREGKGLRRHGETLESHCN